MVSEVKNNVIKIVKENSKESSNGNDYCGNVEWCFIIQAYLPWLGA